jgi:hypothetical protein
MTGSTRTRPRRFLPCWPGLPRDHLAIIIACTLDLPMRKSRALTAEVLTKRGADRLAALLLDAADHDAALAHAADRSGSSCRSHSATTRN